jgi:hypothetical protein
MFQYTTFDFKQLSTPANYLSYDETIANKVIVGLSSRGWNNRGGPK